MVESRELARLTPRWFILLHHHHHLYLFADLRNFLYLPATLSPHLLTSTILNMLAAVVSAPQLCCHRIIQCGSPKHSWPLMFILLEPLQFFFYWTSVCVSKIFLAQHNLFFTCACHPAATDSRPPRCPSTFITCSLTINLSKLRHCRALKG